LADYGKVARRSLAIKQNLPSKANRNKAKIVLRLPDLEAAVINKTTVGLPHTPVGAPPLQPQVNRT
jgi:hypothetical protein